MQHLIGERAKCHHDPTHMSCEQLHMDFHMDNEFHKRQHYLGGKKRKEGGHSLELFVVAIRAPSCQACSKAGAAVVCVM